MIKVLFAHAANPMSETENRYSPLWPAYLAAYAEKIFGLKYVEFKYMTGDCKSEISSYKPNIFAIGSVTQNWNYARECIRIAKSLGVSVILGGMHISALPNSLFENADVGVIGEGEETFVDLIRHHSEYGQFKPSELEKINGIVFRADDNMVCTQGRMHIKDIDTIPHPKRSLIGYGKRNYMITARGCQYKCVFCICSRFWGKIRYSSPEYVIEEVKELVDNGAKVIRFNDDNLSGNVDRLARISELVTRNGFHRKVKFSCWGRANNITPETVKFLKSMNVVSVVMGLESGSDKTLNYLKGSITVEQNRQAVQLLVDAGIQANADFIIGAPHETESEMMETYRFIKKNKIGFVTINVFSPLPGTPVWEYALSRNLVSENMDWGNLTFKFNADPKSCVLLSETMKYSELARVYRKFKRLENYRNILAIPRSPWLSELPGVIRKRIIGKISATGKRAGG